MDLALAKVNEVWLRDWKREVKRAELLALLDFCWPREEEFYPDASKEDEDE
jgi:hypothetical protein